MTTSNETNGSNGNSTSNNGSLSLPSSKSNSPSPSCGLSPQLSENDEEQPKTEKSALNNLVVAFGDNNDVYIYFSRYQKLEVWRWTDDESLSFVNQLDLSKWLAKGLKVTKMLILKSYSQLLLVTSKSGLIYDLDTEGGLVVKSFPFSDPNEITNCAIMGKYLIFDTNGKLTIYKHDANTTEYKELHIPNVQSQAGINIAPPYTLQTSAYKGVGVYAIHQNWLVYSPTKEEYKVLKSTTSKHKKAIKRQEKLANKNKKVNGDEYINGSANALLLALENDKSGLTSTSRRGSLSKSSTNEIDSLDDNIVFTPVKLPPPGPLLNKVLNSLSNQALDGLFKLGEAGSKQLKLYLQQQQQQQLLHPQPQESMSINDLGKTLGKMLFSTAKSTAKEITKQTKHVTSLATSAVQHQLAQASQSHNNGHGNGSLISSEDPKQDGFVRSSSFVNEEETLNSSTPIELNQLVKIVDLENDKVLGLFRAPGGDLAHVSLSPYDMHLVTVGSRGDTFYLWDLYQLPIEISLVGKFQRGKTSAKIIDIVWLNQMKANDYSKTKRNRIGSQLNKTMMNNDTAKGDSQKDINGDKLGVCSATYGFGCITKSHGLVHWFDLNYLSLTGQKKPNTDSNNWILSSIDARKFAKVPLVESGSICSQPGSEELAILDEALDLILVSPATGSSLYKFQFPRSPLSPDLVGSARAEALKQNYSTNDQQFPITDTFSDSDGDRGDNNNNDDTNVVEKPQIKYFFDHLSQVEMESCVPYTHAINNPRLSLHNYKITECNDHDQFHGLIDQYFGEDFGNEIDATPVPVIGVSKVW